MSKYHVPVLLEECLEGLAIQGDATYVDVTFGGGGHSRAILQRLSAKGRLLAFDQDEDAIENKIEDERFELIESNFQHLRNQLRFHDALPVQGLLADLGVSSHQFDEAGRGFSFRFDEAVLDMRMDSRTGPSAKDILNKYSEEELAGLFYRYGELSNSRKLARAICVSRAAKAIETVADLKEAIRACVPKYNDYKYYAQLFQALRIEVNREMEALQALLEQSADVIDKGGRLVVISYHSLEDRLVKNYMSKGKFSGEVEKDFYGNEIKPFRIISRKAITPAEEELERNPRSRSARLRIAERI